MNVFLITGYWFLMPSLAIFKFYYVHVRIWVHPPPPFFFWWDPRLLIFLRFFVMLCCALFVLVLCLVCPMLPVSLECQFVIAPSIFSNVYLLKEEIRLPLRFSLTFIYWMRLTMDTAIRPCPWLPALFNGNRIEYHNI